MANMFKRSFKKDVIVTGLKNVLSEVERFKMSLTDTKKKIKKQAADLLTNGETERACTQVKVLIRDDNRIEAMDILEVYCGLIVEQIGLIQVMKDLDPSLAEAVSTILWAAPRLETEIPAMKTVADQLCIKYGKEYYNKCQANALGTVNQTVLEKFGIEPPPKFLVDEYLSKICAEFDIPWQSNEALGASALYSIYDSLQFQDQAGKGENVRVLRDDSAYEIYIVPQPAANAIPILPNRNIVRPLFPGMAGSASARGNGVLRAMAPGGPQPGDRRQSMDNVANTETRTNPTPDLYRSTEDYYEAVEPVD